MLLPPTAPRRAHLGSRSGHVVLAHGLGWAWAGLFNHAVTLMHPNAPGRATRVTQTGVAAGGALGPLGFGLLAAAVPLSAA